MAKIVSLEQGQLIIKFSGSDFAQNLALVKSLDGREFVKDKSLWIAPNNEKNFKLLKEAGFEMPIISISEKVKPKIDKSLFEGFRDYQIDGVTFLESVNGYGMLNDDMGIGKTIQAIGYAKLHPEIRPILVICPASIKLNWAYEIKRWINEDAYILSGEKPTPVIQRGFKWYIINYDIMAYNIISTDPKNGKRKVVDIKGWIDRLPELNIKGIIVDEFQFISNNASLRTRAVTKAKKTLSPKMFIGLSGTPMRNRPADLFPILNLLNPLMFPNRWKYLWRYCLPYDAPILMNDLSEKRIKDIKIGDYVIGWKRNNSQRILCESKVKDVITKKAQLVKVTLSNGKEIYCTKDHKWLTGRSERGNEDKEYSIPKIGRLGGPGSNCASKMVEIFTSIKGLYINTDDYKKGYIQGFFMGDGFCSYEKYIRYNYFREKIVRNYKKYIIGCACKDKEPITRLHEYLDYFNIKHSLIRRGDGLYSINSYRKETFYFFKEIEKINTVEKHAGFLGGIYDAEGSGKVISQYIDINRKTSELIEQALKCFNIKYKIQKNRQGFTINGIRKEFFRFWKIASPTLIRKLKTYLFNHGGKFMLDRYYVSKIEDVPKVHTVYTLTTETGNYVAYGMGSKNCGPKNNGFGWQFIGATNTEELHNKISPMMIRRLKNEVLKELPAKQKIIIPMELNPIEEKEYLKADNEFIAWLKDHIKNGLDAQTQMEKLKQLAYLAKRNSVIQWIKDYLTTDNKLVVFTYHTKALADIYSQFKDISVTLDGSTPANERKSVVDKFQNDSKIRLFIGQIQAAGIGITLTAANACAFVEFGYSPFDHEQAEDRINRIGQTADSITAYYLLNEDSVETDLMDLLNTKYDDVSKVLDGKPNDDFFQTNMTMEVIKKYRKKLLG